MQQENDNPKKLKYIKCFNCNHTSTPHRWYFGKIYWILAIATLFAKVPLLLLSLLLWNPYICEKCKKRHKLIKILNDGTEVKIKSLPKEALIVLVILFSIGLYPLFLLFGNF